MTLPPNVAELFQNRNVLSAEWRPFEDSKATIPRMPGIYALGFTRGIRYDGGVSCVVYIGSAANLRQRLSTHFLNDHNHYIGLLRQHFGQLSVTWWHLPDFESAWRLTAEGEAICFFERKFGSVPLCNLAVQPTPHAKLLRDLVEIAECRVEDPIQLDDFRQLGFRLRPTFRPGPVEGRITANQWFYEGVKSPTDDQLAQFAQLASDREIEDLSWTSDENVAAWSIAKMCALIKIARSLTRADKSANVIRLQSGRRRTPRPHTWGEVALVRCSGICGQSNVLF